MKKSIAYILTIPFFIGFANAESLNEISIFAKDICDDIRPAGSIKKEEVEAKLKGKIGSIAKLIGGSVSIDGSLSRGDTVYEGLPFDELPAVMKDARSCKKDIAKMLLKERSMISDDAKAPSGKTNSHREKKKPGIIDLGNTLVEIEKCSRSGSLVCSFFLTSKNKDRNVFIYANFPKYYSSKVHDNLRNTHKASAVQIADSGRSGNQQAYNLSADTPVRARLIFDNISEDATQINLLHVQFTYGGGAGTGSKLYNAKFKNIPIN